MTAPPPHLPGYRIGRVLGRGGTASVWAATRSRDGLACAVKVVRPEHGLDAALAEAALLEAIRDDHVVRLLDVVVVDGARDALIALVLERADGGTLERVVAQRGRLSPAETATVLVPVAQALDRLHARGVVHGDLAPGNVLLTADGRPVLADLGLARVAGGSRVVAAGTEGFVAPEVLDGGEPGPAADVFSVAALGWYALVGDVPDITLTRGRLLDHAPETPEALADLLERALRVAPGERPGAAELARGIFDAAPPAPVNLAPGDDPGAALTVRLRAGREAAVPAGHPRTPRWRRALRRTRRRLVRHAVPLLVGSGCLLLATGLSGWTADDDEPGKSTSPAVPGARPRPPRPAPAGGTAPRGVPPSRTAAPPEVLRDPQAPATRGTALLDGLLERRARAWNHGDQAMLAAAEAPRSAALAEDTAAIARARAEGVAFTGLRFETGSVPAAVPARGRVVLRAWLGRAACTARTPDGARTVPAEPRRSVTLVLRWTDAGWRIESWTAGER